VVVDIELEVVALDDGGERGETVASERVMAKSMCSGSNRRAWIDPSRPAATISSKTSNA